MAQQSTDRKLFKTSIDLTEDERVSAIDMLDQTLADATDLHSQVKYAHWNVKGPEFYQVHLLFDDIAEVTIGHIDLIAERAATLGGRAHGTTRMAAENSRLEEMDTDATTGMEFVSELVDRMSTHADFLRSDIDNTEGVVGFFGASSIERLPTEEAIQDQAREFKQIDF